MKHSLLAFAAIALLGVGGCDAASELAGDAIASELRTQFIEQCQGVAEGAGIASERVAPACECSADEFAADLADDGALQINEARMAQVLRNCVQEQRSTGEAPPAENING